MTQITSLHVAWALVEQGRFIEARPMLERCHEGLRAEGRPHFIAMTHLAQLVCAADEEAWAACEHQLEVAIELLDETGFIDFTIPRLAQLAAVRMVEAEETELALKIYSKCLEWWRRLGHKDLVLEMHSIVERLS